MSKYLIILWAGILIPTIGYSNEINKPNILFAFADDWGKYASAYAGVETKPSPNMVVKTPIFALLPGSLDTAFTSITPS